MSIIGGSVIGGASLGGKKYVAKNPKGPLTLEQLQKRRDKLDNKIKNIKEGKPVKTAHKKSAYNDYFAKKMEEMNNEGVSWWDALDFGAKAAFIANSWQHSQDRLDALARKEVKSKKPKKYSPEDLDKLMVAHQAPLSEGSGGARRGTRIMSVPKGQIVYVAK